MNRIQQLGGGIAVLVASAAALAFVAHASPEPPAEPAALSSIPPQTAASLAAICSTVVDDGRPDPAWMRQSFENDNCLAPDEPPVLDGTKVGRGRLMAGLAAAKTFVASADKYQQCISAYMAARKLQAERTGTPTKVTFVTIETHRMVASEASKKRVSGSNRSGGRRFQCRRQ